MAISSPRHLVYIYSETFGLQADNYWVELPTPSEYSGISTTLVDSGRNSSGEIIADVIKSDVAKVEITWNYLTVAQYSKIAKLFEKKYGGEFFVPVSFFDVISGNYEGDITIAPNTTTNKIRLFYPNDRKVDFAHIKLDSNGKPIGYVGVSLHLIDTGKIYGETV